MLLIDLPSSVQTISGVGLALWRQRWFLIMVALSDERSGKKKRLKRMKHHKKWEEVHRKGCREV